MSDNWKWGLSFLNLLRGNDRRPPGKSSSNRVELQLEVLEDRWVPSTLDLTTAGNIGTFNGAIFQQANPQPTGPGVINDFLRIQGKAGVQEGYNTDVRPLQFDNVKSDPNHTRSFQLSELPTVTAGGQTYSVLLLGVNQAQSSANQLLSLDELRLYVSNSSTLTGYDPFTQHLGGQSAVYDMGASNWVLLNSALSSGTGSGDMFLFVPTSAFQSGGAGSNPYVYLYSKFGVNDAANGGFEQWAPGQGTITPPITVSGFVFANVNGTNSPLTNVQLTLTGTTTSGQTVMMTTFTDVNGFYSFVGFVSGTYTITETQPPRFVGVVDSVGTVNGVTDGTTEPGVLTGDGLITDIVLHLGDQGINYDFIEQLRGVES